MASACSATCGVVGVCPALCTHLCVCVHRVLTLALIGTISGRRLPRVLVETGAAAVTGAPTSVVLAGTLQPVGQTRAHKVVQDQE